MRIDSDPGSDEGTYIIVSCDEDRKGDMCATISSLIEQGYSPAGGIAVRAGSSRGADLIQAMFRLPVNKELSNE